MDELAFFTTHRPPPDADAAFFTHGGAPVTGDTRVRVQRAVMLRSAARVGAAGRIAKAGMALRMARCGQADARATLLARRQAGPAALGVMLRALLGRLRCAPSELLHWSEY